MMSRRRSFFKNYEFGGWRLAFKNIKNEGLILSNLNMRFYAKGFIWIDKKVKKDYSLLSQ
jgi:hypothetical protein